MGGYKRYLDYLEAMLVELPKKPVDPPKGGYRKSRWIEDEDLALIKYWPDCVQSDVSRVLRRSVRDCIDRYKYLIEAKKKPGDT
jgi:hypothetical protein